MTGDGAAGRWSGVRLWIFDADGTLRRTTVPGQPCPRGPGEWELLPGVRERLAALNSAPERLRIGVASNQDQVGYGLLSEVTARHLLGDMIALALGPRDADVRVELCPHTPEAACDCRKPAPGMLRAIMDHFGVPPGDTLFVGNAPTDREAAARAGVGFAWSWEFFGRHSEPSGEEPSSSR